MDVRADLGFAGSAAGVGGVAVGARWATVPLSHALSALLCGVECGGGGGSAAVSTARLAVSTQRVHKEDALDLAR